MVRRDEDQRYGGNGDAVRKPPDTNKSLRVKSFIRYTLTTVVELDAEGGDQLTDLIQHNREIGTCEVVSIVVVDTPKKGEA